MTISVGDIAEQILAQEEFNSRGPPLPPTIQPDPSVYSANATEQAPDISDVEVPDDFINSIVEGKAPMFPTPAVKEEVPSPQPISEVAELKSLVQEVKDLLVNFKQTLVEMGTTVGMGIGAPAPPQKEEPEEEDPMKAILKRLRKKKAAK